MYNVLLFKHIPETILLYIFPIASIGIQMQRKILVKICTELLTLTIQVGMGE